MVPDASATSSSRPFPEYIIHLTIHQCSFYAIHKGNEGFFLDGTAKMQQMAGFIVDLSHKPTSPGIFSRLKICFVHRNDA
jgi:hypothetical protein